jgi:hypothetical protein
MMWETAPHRAEPHLELGRTRPAATVCGMLEADLGGQADEWDSWGSGTEDSHDCE